MRSRGRSALMALTLIDSSRNEKKAHQVTYKKYSLVVELNLINNSKFITTLKLVLLHLSFLSSFLNRTVLNTSCLKPLFSTLPVKKSHHRFAVSSSRHPPNTKKKLSKTTCPKTQVRSVTISTPKIADDPKTSGS